MASDAISQILDLKFMFWRATDRGNVDEVLDCLCQNVVVDFEGIPPIRGRTAYREFLEASLSSQGRICGRHIGFNPQITLVDSDRALGDWGIQYIAVDPDKQTMTQLLGEYCDEYVMIDGNWLIRSISMRRNFIATQCANADSSVTLTVSV
jgi:hypothetical protein